VRPRCAEDERERAYGTNVALSHSSVACSTSCDYGAADVVLPGPSVSSINVLDERSLF
jgi:hypothetical protein